MTHRTVEAMAAMSAARRDAQVRRVLLVDDHEIARAGLRALLDDEPDLTVVGEASSAPEAVEAAARLRPDVIVMDVRLGDGSGIEATREIRSADPDVNVLMLTSFADDEALVASILAGASGFALKQLKGVDIVGSVREVAAGRSLMDPAMTAAVVDRVRQGKQFVSDDRLARLTAGEERILELIALGLTNREIAARLNRSEKTVKNQVSNILSKLQVARRVEAAAYVARSDPDRHGWDH